MRTKLSGVVVVGLMVVLVGCVTTTSKSPKVEVPRISIEELKGMLNDPNIAIIDVRSEIQWNLAETKIQGAVWEDKTKIDSWIDKYPKEGKTLIFYCA